MSLSGIEWFTKHIALYEKIEGIKSAMHNPNIITLLLIWSRQSGSLVFG
jgi:hypothetical protein